MTLEPEYLGRMEPRYPCRVMPTRHCPASLGALCPDSDPCARFESDDEAPWALELQTPWDVLAGIDFGVRSQEDIGYHLALLDQFRPSTVETLTSGVVPGQLGVLP